MGFLFTSKKKKDKVIAIFDIGSGSVGGALVKISSDKNSNPTILTSIRKEIPLKDGLDHNDFVSSMSNSLYLVANSLLHTKIIAPEDIFCVLASPWYASENRVIDFNKKKSFIFTKKIADQLLNEETEKIILTHKSKYGDSLETLDVPNIIEQHILSVYIDGLNTVSPIGARCKDVTMNLIISFSPRLCILKIKESINRVFHTSKINFLSFTSATHIVLRDKYVKDNSYIMLDVAGEITDIGLVYDGALVQTASFPFGRNTILKRICNRLDLELRDAKELLKLYNRDNLSSSYKDKLSPVIENINLEWLKYFTNSIDQLSSHINSLPKNIFITADDDIKDFISSIINNIDNYNILHNNFRYNVEKIESFDLLGSCNFEYGYHDPFLMIEAIAINKKINKDK